MRRWICLALAVLAFSAGPGTQLARAQEPPNIRDLLATAGLTEADVPQGLALDPRRSGLLTTEDGRPSYMATFMADGTGDRSLMGVVNVVEEYPDAATGIEAITERFRTGLGGSITDLPTPTVGEASRAFTSSRQILPGAPAANTAFVAIRRASVVATVAVASLGDAPRIDLALRLAQDVDRRLLSALISGGSTGGS